MSDFNEFTTTGYEPSAPIPRENTFALQMHAAGVVGQGTAEDPPIEAATVADNQNGALS